MKQLTAWRNEACAKHGWIWTLYSSIMLWNIRTGWATSSPESDEAIEALHDRIWTVSNEGDGGCWKTHQLMAWKLPCILWTCFPPSHYSWLSTLLHQGSRDSLPEVYTAQPKSRMDILDFCHVPPPQSDWKALDVLREEIVKNVCGTTEKEKAIQPTWLMSMANVSTIGVKAAEVGAGDGPTSSPCMHHSPVPCTSHSPVQHSQMRSPSLHWHSQSSTSSSSSSGSSSRSASGSSCSGSSQSGSSDESHAGSPARSHAGSQAGSQAPSEGSGSSGSECSQSTSPDVVPVQGRWWGYCCWWRRCRSLRR